MTNVELTPGCARFLSGVHTEHIEKLPPDTDPWQFQQCRERLVELEEAISRAEAKAKEPQHKMCCCAECEGTGEIPSVEVPPAGPEYARDITVACPKCGGSGVIQFAAGSDDSARIRLARCPACHTVGGEG